MNAEDFIFADKKKLRDELRNKRRMLAPEKKNELSRRITENIIFFFGKLDISIINEKNFFSYSAYDNEVDLFEFNKKIIQNCGYVYLPVLNGNEMEFYKQKNLDNFVNNKYGIKEPCAFEKFSENESIFDKDRIIIFCPGIGFDKKLVRLGSGKGFYDRYLKKNISSNFIKIGIIYNFAFVENLPKNDFDINMDYVITESEIWNSSGKLFTI